MNSFTYNAPTEIIFGEGAMEGLGGIAARFGAKALLVTDPAGGPTGEIIRRALAVLEGAGLAVAHFDGVVPNPTTQVVTAGALVAKASGAQVVVGLGGGSALDTAKAVAVEATHPGTAWDYLHYTGGPTEKTLPIIAVGTTAGTGSQTTPCAVITNTEQRDKSAIWHRNILPRAAVVDPALTHSMPPALTAATGFDAFCHNFEAFLSVGGNPMTEALALDAIGRVARYLPRAVRDGGDKEARSQMAWVDTLGGLTNASAGVTLPHGLGMQVGGLCPHVAHGRALAAIYPAFTRYTLPAAVEKFAAVGRLLDKSLAALGDEQAAQGCCAAIDTLLKEIGLWIGFDQLGVGREELLQAADRGQVLGDYRNNPRVATIPEMRELLLACHRRA